MEYRKRTEFRKFENSIVILLTGHRTAERVVWGQLLAGPVISFSGRNRIPAKSRMWCFFFFNSFLLLSLFPFSHSFSIRWLLISLCAHMSVCISVFVPVCLISSVVCLSVRHCLRTVYTCFLWLHYRWTGWSGCRASPRSRCPYTRTRTPHPPVPRSIHI